VILPYLPGDIIGLDGAFSARQKSPVEVRAETDSLVLLIDVNALRAEPEFRDRLNDNLLTLLSERGIQGIQRMDILLGMTLRERITTFLRSVSRQTEDDTISLDMTQAEMARYFSVNRSALSRELNKMQSEGLIQILPKGRYRIMQWTTKAPPVKRPDLAEIDNTDMKENTKL